MTGAPSRADREVIVLPTTRRDGDVCGALLAKAGIQCTVARSIDEICRRIKLPVGALILTDDLKSHPRLPELLDALSDQPSWSDVPIILLSRPAVDLRKSIGRFSDLTNLTVLDRPTSSRALISAVAAAIRGRERQYQLRDQLRSLEGAQSALQESADQMGLAVQLAGLALAELTYKPRTIRLSSQTARLFGISGGSRDIAIEQFLDSIVVEDREEVKNALVPGEAADGAAFALKYRVMHPENGIRWVSHIHQVMFSEGLATHAVIVALDVTEQTNADRRKDEFLATLAHELRNPLAPIRTGLQALARAGDNEAMTAKLRAIMQRQLGQMVRLIDDLLDVSRISSGKVILQKQRMDLRSAIELAIEGSQPYINAEEHHFEVEMPPAPLWVDGDTSRLSQVVTNLLNNAAKYTPRGGRMSLRLSRGNHDAKIEISDSGLGIPPDMLDQVFTLFTQVNRTLDRAQGGLGVGLSLVRELIQLHNGTVVAESAGLGRGSRFVVTLPLLADRDATPQPNTAAQESSRSSENLRVLIVDDIVDVADTMAMLLDLEGFQTKTAHNGHDALTAAAEFEPDVILCDIGLPEMDGFEIARRLRALEFRKPLTLVAITGWGGPDATRKTQEAGYDFHLVKPVGAESIKSILENRFALYKR